MFRGPSRKCISGLLQKSIQTEGEQQPEYDGHKEKPSHTMIPCECIRTEEPNGAGAEVAEKVHALGV